MIYFEREGTPFLPVQSRKGPDETMIYESERVVTEFSKKSA